MMDGIAQLRLARGHLDGVEGDARCRLRSAAREFWWATAEAETWPERLQIEASRLQPLLLRRGAVNAAVAAMDDTSVDRVSAELRAFCEAAELCVGVEIPTQIRQH